MKNLTRNTAAVLVVTLFTGLAVFSAIQLGGRLFGTTSANAQTVSSQAAVQPPAESESGEDYGYEQGSGSGSYADPYGQSSDGYSDPYGQSSGGSQSYVDPHGQSDSGSSSGTTMTCPATGCSASSCHATQ
jgi:hypothetical protein